MGAGVESRDRDRVKKLVQEAYMLSTQIAAMDKQLQDKIDKYNGPLVTWFNGQDDLTKKGIEQGYDKAKEKSLEIAFKELLRFLRVPLKVGTKVAEKSSGIVVGLLTPVSNNYGRARVDDENAEFIAARDAKRERLRKIYDEIFLAAPPTINLHTNICDRENCWKSN
jgi:hypothetical protein